MRIGRHKHHADYLVLPNQTVRDQRLSYLARAVLAELLSRPDGWETTADKLAEDARRERGEKRGEGRRAIREAFVELEYAGYMRRDKTRDKRGRFVTTAWVSDLPIWHPAWNQVAA